MFIILRTNTNQDLHQDRTPWDLTCSRLRLGNLPLKHNGSIGASFNDQSFGIYSLHQCAYNKGHPGTIV